MNMQKSMKITLLSLLVLMVATITCCTTPGVGTPAGAANATGGESLESVKKTNDAWKVLANPIVKQSMISVMGNKYSLFKQRTDSLNSPEVQGDEIFSHGGVEGLYTIQESAFSFNTKTRRMQVALLDDTNLNIWGATNQNTLSQPMQNYISDLKTRAEDNKVKLVFEAPNQSTIATSGQPVAANPTKVPTHLNLTSPTGIYERQGNQEDARLEVLQLSPGQIKFHLHAYHAANTGDASGVVQMTKNQGTYQGDNYQLVFVYNGKTFYVQQTGDGVFGGMSVRADGLYTKTSDDTPSIPDQN